MFDFFHGQTEYESSDFLVLLLLLALVANVHVLSSFNFNILHQILMMSSDVFPQHSFPLRFEFTIITKKSDHFMTRFQVFQELALVTVILELFMR